MSQCVLLCPRRHAHCTAVLATAPSPAAHGALLLQHLLQSHKRQKTPPCSMPQLLYSTHRCHCLSSVHNAPVSCPHTSLLPPLAPLAARQQWQHVCHASTTVLLHVHCCWCCIGSCTNSDQGALRHAAAAGDQVANGASCAVIHCRLGRLRILARMRARNQ
jgi:hypothetical protein